MSWKPDRLLKAILIWTMISLVFVWLPLVRGVMDGDSYQWGNSFFGFDVGGRGVHGSYWIVVLQASLGLAVLILGWRGAKQPFHWLLLLWHILLGAQAIYNSLKFPEEYRFRGDTLGVDVSLAWVGPVLFGGFALLSIWWVVRDLRRAPIRLSPEWRRANVILLSIAAVMLPLQFILLRFGEQHGTNDQIGVLLTMLQLIVINLGLYPWGREVQQPAPAAT
jgi:hypothetical protein